LLRDAHLRLYENTLQLRSSCSLRDVQEQQYRNAGGDGAKLS